MTTEKTVEQIGSRMKIDPSGCAFRERTFRVTRQGGSPHIVVVVENADDFAPESERCDCPGFRYRKSCSHITALYASLELGVMSAEMAGDA